MEKSIQTGLPNNVAFKQFISKLYYENKFNWKVNLITSWHFRQLSRGLLYEARYYNCTGFTRYTRENRTKKLVRLLLIALRNYSQKRQFAKKAPHAVCTQKSDINVDEIDPRNNL